MIKKLLILFVTLLALTACVKAPVNLKKLNTTTSSAKITWDKVEWAERYRVYRSNKLDGEYVEVNSAFDNKYEDPGLYTGQIYYYKVKSVAFSNFKESEFSDIIEVETDISPPINLKYKFTNGVVNLSWVSALETGLFNIYRSNEQNGGYVKIGESLKPEFNDAKIEATKTYFYKITCVKGKVESAFCDLVKVNVGFPEIKNFEGMPTGTKSITLNWSSVEGATDYGIYRCGNDNGEFEKIALTQTTKYEDKNLLPGKVYYYKIKSVNLVMESNYSETIMVATLLAAPSNIKALDQSSDLITITWDVLDRATTYKVFRSDKIDGEFKEVVTLKDNIFVDSNLESGVAYYYKIKGMVGVEIDGQFSEIKKYSTYSQIIKLRKNSVTYNGIRFSWNKVNGVNQYSVLRSTEENDKYSVVATTEKSMFEDVNLKPGIKYYYKVSMIKNNVEIVSEPIYKDIVSEKSVVLGDKVKQKSEKITKNKKNDTKKSLKNNETTITEISENNEVTEPTEQTETAESKEIAADNNTGNDYDVYGVAYNSQKGLVAEGGSDGVIRIWSSNGGKKIKVLKGHKGSVNTIDFSMSGEILASGGSDGIIRIWNVTNGTVIRAIKAHSDKINSISFSLGSRLLVSGSNDRTVKIWDVNTGKEIRSFSGHGGAVNGVCFSPDSRYAASASSDKTTRIWDIENGKAIDSLLDKYIVDGKIMSSYVVGTVSSVAYSPDGKWLATGNSDNKIKIWNVSNGELVMTLKGHIDSVTSVVFNRSGTRLISGSYDKTLKVWDVSDPNPKKWQFVVVSEYLNGHLDFITSLGIGSDGKAVSGSKDGLVKLWELSIGKAIATFD